MSNEKNNESLLFKENNKTTEIIEDYLDLIRCSYPYCNCGKCISRKYSNNLPNFHYDKNLKSSYKIEFEWKIPEDKHVFGSGRKPFVRNLGLDNCYKEHLKSSLVSVMKSDYSRNLKLKENMLINNTLLSNKLGEESISKATAEITNKLKDNINNNQLIKKDSKTFENKQNGSHNYIKINKIKYNTKQSASSLNKRSNKTKINYSDNNKQDLYISNNHINISQLDDKKYVENNNDNNEYNTNKNIQSISCILDSSIINSNKNNNNKVNPSFIGRSNYELMYPNWQTTKIIKEKETANLPESVPFNGRSSYQENYHEHEKRYYIERASPILKSDNLEASGKLNKETTSKNSYKPINYVEFRNLNNDLAKIAKRPSSIVSAPYSRDSFLSSYERAFMYNNIKTKRRILNDNDENNNGVLY